MARSRRNCSIIWFCVYLLVFCQCLFMVLRKTRTSSSKKTLLQDISTALTKELPQYLPPHLEDHTALRLVQKSLLCTANLTVGRVNAKDVRRKHFPFDFPCTPLPSLSLRALCASHSIQRILFVGPETTYHLHRLWLDALSSIENRSHSCRGPAFCTFHHICRPTSDGSERLEDIRNQRTQKLPSNEDLGSSNSSILRYIMSSTLLTSTDRADDRYSVPQIDPLTGVRIHQMPWLAQARKSDVVVLSRGPVPAPAWTYDGSPQGNWSFVDAIYTNHSSAYISDASERASRVINAALHVTLAEFLPSLARTLLTVYADADIGRRKARWIWHSSLYQTEPCLVPTPYLDQAILGKHDDLWALYFNAQVYIHNFMLPRLLPFYGIVYMPLVASTYESSVFIASKECWHPELDTPFGREIGQQLFNALGHVFQS
ncbi:hypothetical protein BDZ89DRAFT_1073882 [Hymenopellis radicata]|nr:hypothetical protein BDZ89DRAFT_1073882 [Hymenopellis radicata]